MKNWISFNDFNTLENDMLIEELPMVSRAQENKELIKIDGRNGFLTLDDGTFDSIPYDVQLNIKSNDQIELVKSIFRGSGKLIISKYPDRVYQATINNKIDFDRVLSEFHTCMISFELQPFGYDLDCPEIEMTKKPHTIVNTNSIYSTPYIKVYGTGGKLYVNNETITLSNIDEYVELDCELENCYKGTENCNNKMIGDFVVLDLGENVINWDGGITKVVINPRWRNI